MTVICDNTEEQPDPRNVAGSGSSIRRRSARLMTREAKKSNDTSSSSSSSERGEASEKKRKRSGNGKAAKNDVVDAPIDSDDKSAYVKVTEAVRTFNKHYLHFVQEEENRCSRKEVDGKQSKRRPKSKTEDKAPESKRKVARPDLKATSEMKKNKTVLYSEKRFGNLPGIDVGHQFFSRAEMAAVGIHHHWQSGIDYIGKSSRKPRKDLENYKFPVAVSIVMSGQYEDDLDNCEEIVYTGQGGNNLMGNKSQICDQVLERGNLALKNSMEQSVPVRVVRGHKFKDGVVKKVYTYDGLYKVVEYWAETGVAGFTIYKFRLQRLEGQPPLKTKEVYFTRGRIPKSTSEIRGLICEDISGGLENFPIPVTNLVDNPPILPPAFVYIKDIKYGENSSVPTNIPTGCNCKGTCTNPRSCACAKLNGGDFPYVHKNEGRLVEAKSVVFECGPNCSCGPDCVNRTSQKGLKFRLEVFRTPKKGWGVRSWDNIPSGAPICEYVGLLRRTADLSRATDNSYVFDIDCLQTMKGLQGRESRLRDVSLPSHLQKDCEEVSESVPFCIDAGETGNVARFINHSCEPNLFVQCVLSNHHDFNLARVMLIAANNIPPLEELTYDYSYELDSVLDQEGNVQQMSCFCGTDECRKRLY